MTENDVEKGVRMFMHALGWRDTRNHVGVFKAVHGGSPITIGTEGFPDWTFTRGKRVERGVSELIHFEAKRPGKKPSKKQFEVMASLNYLGELSVWADSLENFKEVYFQNFPADNRDQIKLF